MRREKILKEEVKKGYLCWIVVEQETHVDLMEMMQTEIESIDPSNFILVKGTYYDIQGSLNDSQVITKFIKINNEYHQKDLSKIDDPELISLLSNKYFKDKKIRILQNEPIEPYDESLPRKTSWLMMYREDKKVDSTAESSYIHTQRIFESTKRTFTTILSLLRV